MSSRVCRLAVRVVAMFALVAMSGGMLSAVPVWGQAAADAPAPPASTAAAQDGQVTQQGGAQPGYHISVTKQVVVLDVVVTDKHGVLQHKLDLTKDDFKIYENKVPQTILSFEQPSKHALPQTDTAIVESAADLKKIGDAPVTMLVLDELNSQFQDMSYARQMMVKYLQAQPAVLKEPTVLMIAMNTKFIQVHDYTQNRDELIDVVKKHMPEFPWRATNGQSGPGAVERMAQVMASLRQLAQSSNGTPGRKNVIWVGMGFPTADLVGLDETESALIEQAMRRVTAQLLASRMTMYTINPMAGSSATVDIETPDDLDTTAAADAGYDPFGTGTVNFTDLAPATGGMSFRGRNDLNNVIAEGIAAGDEYYTISYSPTDKTLDPTKYRDIDIVMKDVNLRATTRKGYFPDSGADTNELADATATAQQKQRDLTLDLSQALTSDIPYNGLDVTVEKAKNGDYLLHVTEQHITWSEPGNDGSEHAEATVASAWYDQRNKILGHIAREETFPRASTGTGATYTLTLPAMPYNMVRQRFVVRDALSGKMGTFDIGGKLDPNTPVKKKK